MENKYDKSWTVYWSYKLSGESVCRTHANTFGTQLEAESLLMGLKHLACRNDTFKAKIIKTEVINVA